MSTRVLNDVEEAKAHLEGVCVEIYMYVYIYIHISAQKDHTYSTLSTKKHRLTGAYTLFELP